MKGLEFKSETHEYYFEGRKIPCVSDILEDAGYINKRFFKPKDADRGKKIHELTQFYDEDDLVESSIDPAFVGHVEAYKKFRYDYRDRIEIISIEEPIYSIQYDFAGTPDRGIKINGELGLIDIKSGVKQAWHVLQVTLYSLCYKIIPKKLFALYLDKNGTYKFPELKDPSAKNVCLGAVVGYQWKQRNMK